jgi:mutator protein MutT
MIDCAVAVIHNGRQFLITQRKHDDHFGGYWEFPGGKCEEGETLEACAVREAREEVGLDVAVDRFLLTVTNPYKDKALSLHFFLCRPLDGREPRPIEVADWRWVTAGGLRAYLFPPANERLIAHLLETFPDTAVR